MNGKEQEPNKTLLPSPGNTQFLPGLYFNIGVPRFFLRVLERKEEGGGVAAVGRREEGKSKGGSKVRNISELGLTIILHHNCLCKINGGTFHVTSSTTE